MHPYFLLHILEDAGVDNPFIPGPIDQFLEFVILSKGFVQPLRELLVVQLGLMQLLFEVC